MARMARSSFLDEADERIRPYYLNKSIDSGRTNFAAPKSASKYRAANPETMTMGRPSSASPITRVAAPASSSATAIRVTCRVRPNLSARPRSSNRLSRPAQLGA